ncbi:MAG: hypothetical protein ACLP5H_34385 [Desulfomonilaceae bacterium]
MKADKTAQDTDLSSIPGEFRENYRFLSELINCKHKNNSAAQCLEKVLEPRLCHIRGKLNRRQIRILNLFVKDLENSEPESLAPPVPAELEAAILVRKRSTWLPWEAEAIRKIERWREDLLCISQNWGAGFAASHSPKYLRRSAETSG